jgi:hypothetical protein
MSEQIFSNIDALGSMSKSVKCGNRHMQTRRRVNIYSLVQITGLEALPYELEECIVLFGHLRNWRPTSD